MSGTGSYLYAVAETLPSAAMAGVDGVGDATVRTLAGHGLTFVVSDVDLNDFDELSLRRNLENLDWLERNVRCHDAVVRAVAAFGAVLPLRFGTVYHDDASLVAQLEPRYDAIRSALRRLDGCVEWAVKVFSRPDDPAQAELTRPATGAEYLDRRRASFEHDACQHLTALADADAIFGELEALATASNRQPDQAGALASRSRAMVLNAAFLVDRLAEPRFCAAVDQLTTQRPAGAIAASGPWPPYSFVDWATP